MGLDSTHHKELVHGPPTKRRRMQPEIDVDILGEITTKLYSLLGLQSATDLGGLNNVAE